MTDIDSGQPLATGAKFVQHLLGLGFAELGIHQDGIVLAADDYRADREQGRTAGVIDIQLQRLLGGLNLGQGPKGGERQKKTAQGQ
ncbi:hypothetical protein D3C80_571040 [compost metagenome]